MGSCGSNVMRCCFGVLTAAKKSVRVWLTCITVSLILGRQWGCVPFCFVLGVLGHVGTEIGLWR